MRDAGNRAPLRLFGRGKRVKTVRINHLRAALLAVAAAGLLAAVGLLVVVLYASLRRLTFLANQARLPMQDTTDKTTRSIPSIPTEGARNNLLTTPWTTANLPTRLPARR